MLYTVLYMARRTQIYLDDGQRKRIDELRKRTGKSLAAIVREALEQYFVSQVPDSEAALEATFGAAPRVKVPSRSEWVRRG